MNERSKGSGAKELLPKGSFYLLSHTSLAVETGATGILLWARVTFCHLWTSYRASCPPEELVTGRLTETTHSRTMVCQLGHRSLAT